MTQHTPAPWTQSGRLIFKSGEAGGTICEMSELRASTMVDHTPLKLDSKDWDEQMANARLIAAAPALLACCRAMLELHESGSWGAPPGEYLPALRAAIAEATGEAPR